MTHRNPGATGKWYFTKANPHGPATEPVELVRPDGTLAGVTLRTLVNGWGQYQDKDRRHIEEILIKLLNAPGAVVEKLELRTVVPEVEASDLELFAINTGEFYPVHLELVNKPIADWQHHVATTVMTLYRKKSKNKSLPTAVRDAVAVALKDYYTQHVAEWRRQAEAE